MDATSDTRIGSPRKTSGQLAPTRSCSRRERQSEYAPNPASAVTPNTADLPSQSCQAPRTTRIRPPGSRNGGCVRPTRPAQTLPVGDEPGVVIPVVELVEEEGNPRSVPEQRDACGCQPASQVRDEPPGQHDQSAVYGEQVEREVMGVEGQEHGCEPEREVAPARASQIPHQKTHGEHGENRKQRVHASLLGVEGLDGDTATKNAAHRPTFAEIRSRPAHHVAITSPIPERAERSRTATTPSPNARIQKWSRR